MVCIGVYWQCAHTYTMYHNSITYNMYHNSITYTQNGVHVTCTQYVRLLYTHTLTHIHTPSHTYVQYVKLVIYTCPHTHRALATLGHTHNAFMMVCTMTIMMMTHDHSAGQTIAILFVDTSPTPPPHITHTPTPQAALHDMVARVRNYTTQGIANVIWGGGVLGVDPGLVVQPVVDLVIMRLPEFANQELSNLLLGLAKMQIFEPDLVEVCVYGGWWGWVVDRGCGRTCMYLSTGMLLCCMCTHHSFEHTHIHTHTHTFTSPQAILRESLRPARLPLHTLQGIANLCWSLAYMRYHDDVFFGKIAQQLGRRVSLMGPYELSTVLWSLAKLDVKLSPRLLQPLLQQADVLLEVCVVWVKGAWLLCCMVVYMMMVVCIVMIIA